MKRRAPRPRATLTDSLMLAPMVVGMRLPMLAREARDMTQFTGETMRMVSEKAAASAEGLVAAQFSLWGAAMSFWPDVASGKTPSLLDGRALQQSMNAALAPSGKAVQANYTRLSKGR